MMENLPLVLQLHPAIQLTDDQFFEFCQINRDLRIERNAKGELSIMLPTGGRTGGSNFKLIQQLANWVDIDGTGIGFDSSTICLEFPKNLVRLRIGALQLLQV